MRCTLAVAFVFSVVGCGPSPSPVASYVDAVDISLYSDGANVTVSLTPKATPTSGCPTFGAAATIDGQEMEATEFGGVYTSWLDKSEPPRCDYGSYQLPLSRSAQPKTSTVRIADETGEVTFTVVDALTRPVLEWVSASELAPSAWAELRVVPDSLSISDIPYVKIIGLDPSSGRELGADTTKKGSHLWFKVPADAPAGMGQIRLASPWDAQLSAPVTDCKGATKCSACSRFDMDLQLPITVLPM